MEQKENDELLFELSKKLRECSLKNKFLETELKTVAEIKNVDFYLEICDMLILLLKYQSSKVNVGLFELDAFINKIIKILEKEKIILYTPLIGDIFVPEKHEVLEVEKIKKDKEKEIKTNTISYVHAPGFMIGDSELLKAKISIYILEK